MACSRLEQSGADAAAVKFATPERPNLWQTSTIPSKTATSAKSPTPSALTPPNSPQKAGTPPVASPNSAARVFSSRTPAKTRKSAEKAAADAVKNEQALRAQFYKLATDSV